MQTSEPPIPVATVLSWGNEPAPLSDALVARPWIVVAENEVGRIERDIQALQRRRETLLRYITVYRGALAAHKKLPTELLRQIMTICVASQSVDASLKADLNEVLRTRSDVCFTLGRVCSKWRSIVLGTYELWSDVQISFGWGNPNGKEARVSLNLFRTWLARGGKQPLALNISMQFDRRGVGPLLLGCARRLRSLALSPLDCRGFQDLLGLPPGSMGLLEELSLHASSTFPLQQHSTGFLGSSHLRRTTLVGFSDQTLASVDIPWGQLTQLNLERSRISMIQLECILHISPALVHLGIQLLFDDPIIFRDVPFSVLRRLDLYSPSLDQAARFVQRLICPRLQALAIECDYLSPATVSPNQFPQVRRLVIALPPSSFGGRFPSSLGGRFSRVEALPLSWLTACNNAEEIILPHCVLGKAAWPMSTGSLLPHLKLLVVHAPDFAKILPVLQMRHASPEHSTIAEVGLTGLARPLDQAERDTVNELRKAGVFLCALDGPHVYRGQVWLVSYLSIVQNYPLNARSLVFQIEQLALQYASGLPDAERDSTRR
ncbi:hypothetical protein FB45DRAFT_1139914 [Roridomyces roridus]|uniref:F-box domain-containing protein n=1 Tax=Roridomyces roridus TaxID=1738132 RepID=A0AAD7B096_9AGAR|nr:hypothetical protein FB45DRAFT_1139914 [Roridomyces roridus]